MTLPGDVSSQLGSRLACRGERAENYRRGVYPSALKIAGSLAGRLLERAFGSDKTGGSLRFLFQRTP